MLKKLLLVFGLLFTGAAMGSVSSDVTAGKDNLSGIFTQKAEDFQSDRVGPVDDDHNRQLRTAQVGALGDGSHESGCTYAHTSTAGSVICFSGGGSHRAVGWCRNSFGSIRGGIRGPLVGEDTWSQVFCGRDRLGRQMFIYDLDDRHL